MARKPGEKDFRDLKSPTEKAKPDSRPQPNERRDWWNHEGSACAGIIKDVIDTLVQAQSARIRQQVINARLYGAQVVNSSNTTAYARIAATTSTNSRLTYNVVQENTDTLVARVGETKPRPYFLTSGGDYKQQRKAKKLNQFIEGSFYETKAYDLGLEAFRDSAIQGDGFVYCFGRAGKLRKERVWGAELWVDEVEAKYGFPRNMHRVKVVDKDELAATCDSPKDREAIFKASRAIEPGATNSTSDMVTVCESWHLGAADEAGEVHGGKHAIALLDAKYLLGEPDEWPYDFFPFARWSWCKRPVGYYSQSLSEQLQPTQIELNQNLALIQKSARLAGSFKLLLHAGSRVVKEHANNEVGAIITWAGPVEPKYITVSPIDRFYIENSFTLIERARDLAGVSKMQTTGTKPAGELSGKALRTLEDVASERHKSIQRMNDNAYLEMAALDICVASELSKAGDFKPVRVPGDTSFRTIDWKKDIIDVPTDSYVLQCFPISALVGTPEENLQTIQEYVQAGLITPRQGRRALDFPDLQGLESLGNAQEDILSLTLDNIIDDGEYAPPEPTDDLQLAKEMVLEYIQKYRALGLEEEKLDMLRAFNAQCDAMLEEAEQQQMAAQAAMQPQAAPMPPQQSALIPNSTHP